MDHLTTAQVADMLGITQDGVLLLIRRGRLAAEKVGPIWLIRREDAERAKDRARRGRPAKKAEPPAEPAPKKRGGPKKPRQG